MPAVFDPAAEGWEPDEEPGFTQLIGPIWRRRVDRVLRFGLVIETRHLNRDGALHGGMFLAFFDHAVGIVASEAGNAARQVTIQLNTQFIKGAAAGQFVEIESEVVSQSRSYMFMRGVCRCGPVTLAAADGIWKKLHSI